MKIAIFLCIVLGTCALSLSFAEGSGSTFIAWLIGYFTAVGMSALDRMFWRASLKAQSTDTSEG